MRGPRGYFDEIKLLARNYRYQKLYVSNIEDLIQNHFSTWSEPDHLNREIFYLALSALAGAPARIIETGTSAWGTDSTRLWDSYIRKFGGSFTSVDIRPEASQRLKWQLSKKSSLFTNDSVDFLSNGSNQPADLYFLDSWDLDLSDPLPSAQHGLNEYIAIEPHLTAGTLILIDDTPCALRMGEIQKLPPKAIEFIKKYNNLPGKGAFIIQELNKKFEFETLLHDYALLVRVVKRKNAV
jgi:hypothetical protein